MARGRASTDGKDGLTLRTGCGTIPGVPGRRRLSAALLLLAAAALPHLLWLAPHVLEPHEHAREEWTGHSQVLAHGHEHPEGVPDHEHNLVPSPPLRPEPPRDLPAPGIASLESPGEGLLLLSKARPWPGRIGLSGSGPPRLHLLCTLLI